MKLIHIIYFIVFIAIMVIMNIKASKHDDIYHEK